MVPGTLLVTQLLFYSTTGARGQLGQMVYLLKYCWNGGSVQDLKQLSMTFSNKYVSAFLLSLDPLLTIYFMTIIAPPPLFFCWCRNTQRVLQQVFPGKTLHFTVNLQKNLSFLQNKQTENLSQEVPYATEDQKQHNYQISMILIITMQAVFLDRDVKIQLFPTSDTIQTLWLICLLTPNAKIIN